MFRIVKLLDAQNLIRINIVNVSECWFCQIGGKDQDFVRAEDLQCIQMSCSLV